MKSTVIPDDPNANNIKSYGSTYNPAMPFSSPNTASAKLQAAATIVALVKATKDFFSLIESLSSISFHGAKTGNARSTEEPTYRGPGPFKFGMYRPSTSEKVDFVKKILLIVLIIQPIQLRYYLGEF